MFKNSSNKYEIQCIQQMNDVAARLRGQPTPAEEHLWKYLRRNRLLGYKFRRQYAIHRYIVDFICHEKKLVIEVDGEIHEQRKAYDQARDHYLELYGFKTIRFANEDVLHKTQIVLYRIRLLLEGEGGPRQRRGTDKV